VEPPDTTLLRYDLAYATLVRVGDRGRIVRRTVHRYYRDREEAVSEAEQAGVEPVRMAQALRVSVEQVAKIRRTLRTGT